jgi:asparagine synthase (glutamine-hydrolysing)
MCGIWAVLGSYTFFSPDARELLRRLEARGPEYSILQDISGTRAAFGFTRLAINGLTHAGDQPFHHDGIHVVCNGEIYNFRALAERWGIPLAAGTSDCAVLPFLARALHPTELCRTLDGVFAFALVDTHEKTLLVARDPYGVRPLFYGRVPMHGGTTHVWASELKGLPADCVDPAPFPPGTWAKYDLESGQLLETQRYHTIPHGPIPLLADREHARAALRTALTGAVEKRLMSDRPIGALLSGGVDSSLIAALAARELAKHGKRIHTFSIGMPGSTDFAYAQQVADHIGSIHHPILVRPEDFLAAIPEVVRAIESYDITTVRASVGNYLVGKFIRENTDIKVVFNGDGSDEVGGGYLYFYAAPSDEEFEAESARLLDEIHLYDVLRSDRSMAAHGLEARTPFLDKSVVATWRAIATEHRRPRKGAQVEKAILREAFAGTGLLPDAVLWRKKEAFSDGVSSTEDSWYKRCAAHAAAGATATDAGVTEINPPKTQEAAWYRRLFEEAYGARAARVIPHMWLPRWIAGATDPSARTLTELY